MSQLHIGWFIQILVYYTALYIQVAGGQERIGIIYPTVIMPSSPVDYKSLDWPYTLHKYWYYEGSPLRGSDHTGYQFLHAACHVSFKAVSTLASWFLFIMEAIMPCHRHIAVIISNTQTPLTYSGVRHYDRKYSIACSTIGLPTKAGNGVSDGSIDAADNVEHIHFVSIKHRHTYYVHYLPGLPHLDVMTITFCFMVFCSLCACLKCFGW